MFNNLQYTPALVTGVTSAQVFTGPGTIHTISIGTTTATALRLFDSIGAGTGTIAIFKASIVEGTHILDVTVANGLYVVGGAAGTYTITYSK